MDSDDLYFKTYLKKSIEVMKQKKVSLVGSNNMLIIYPKYENKLIMLETDSKRQIHENTMVFTKNHFKMTKGFLSTFQAEGVKLIDGFEKQVGLMNIFDILIQISHDNNVYPKDQFFTFGREIEGNLNPKILNILDSIFNFNKNYIKQN